MQPIALGVNGWCKSSSRAFRRLPYISNDIPQASATNGALSQAPKTNMCAAMASKQTS